MEKFDSGNFRKGQPFAKFFYVRKFACTKINLWKNAGMNESTVLPQIHTQALLVFLFRRSGTGVEARRTFHRRLAACIKTTHL